MKLTPFHPKPDRTLWRAWADGVSLADVLAEAERIHATRVMLTGPQVPREWFLGAVAGWSHGRHHLDHETPTGRYVHDRAGVTVEVRRAAEWFGAGDYTPADAEAAWGALLHVLERSGRTGAALFRSPGATGLDLWLRAARGDVPDPVDDDTQALLRATAPQHRIELRAPEVEQMPGLWVVDGRWMYAALTKGLGSGPVTFLRGEDAAALFARDPYARARYLVRFRAPAGWEDVKWPGLFMAKAGPLASDGWHTPMQGETWADAAEVHLAVRYEWHVEFVEGIAFTPGRPLDSWTARLVRARDNVSDDDLGPVVAQLVRRAVRAVLLHAIGSWHSSGSDEVTVTASAMQRPDGDDWGAPERLDDGAGFLWRRRSSSTSHRALGMRHPEWSAQVWGRAHARILECPTGDPNRPAGAMHLPFGTLVGVYGDAVLTTVRPAWADLDDGKPGRLRVKGHVCGPVPWPTSAAQRDRLTRAADAAGTLCERGC